MHTHCLGFELSQVEKPSIALTIDVEHLYCEDFESCILDIFQFLERRGISSTMFFLGRTVLDHPEILDEAHARGHEIGCHGFDHIPATASYPGEFKTKVKQSKEIIERSIGQSVIGFRSPNFSITNWLFPLLKTLGFKYDSSVYPCLPIFRWYGLRKAPPYPYHPSLGNPEEIDDAETFLEFPLAIIPDLRLPAGGGWWLRNLGPSYCLFSLSRLLRKGPAILYFHPWEFTEKLRSNIEEKDFGTAYKPSFMFRRTGAYVFRLIDRINKEFSPRFVTIKELVNGLAI